MNRNFAIIFKYSFLNKVNSKSFKAFTIVLLLAGLAGSLVPAYISNSKSKENITYGVISNDDQFEALTNYVEAADFDMNFEKTDKKDDFEEEYEYIIDLNDYSVYSYSASVDDEYIVEDIIANMYILETAEKLNLTDDELNQLFSIPEPNYVNLGDDQGHISGAKYLINYAYTIIGMILLMISAQYLGQEVMEEKTTRAMEVIMTSVSAGSHMLAKIVSNFAFIIVILIEGLIFGVIGDKVASLVFPDAPLNSLEVVKGVLSDLVNESTVSVDILFVVMIVLVIFVITVLTLLTFTSAISSSVTTVEEFQNSFSISTLLVMVAYMASLFVTDVNIRIILSYFPIMNFFTLPSLLLSGDVGVSAALISVAGSVAFYALITYFSIRIYRVGVLNYAANSISKVIGRALSRKPKY